MSIETFIRPLFTLNVRWLRFGTCAILAGLSLNGVPGPVDAAARTTPYQKTKGIGCGEPVCKVGLGKVGKNRRIHIDSVSCFIATEQLARFREARLQVGGHQYGALAPVLISGAHQDPHYALNHRVNVVARPGERVSVLVENDPSLPIGNMACKVAGYSVRLK